MFAFERGHDYADRDALVCELAGAVQETLALRIQDAIRRAERNHAPLTPQSRLVAFARGYVTFAINEPAWFDLLCRGHAQRATSRPAGDHTQPSPHELLQAALDDLIATGVIPQQRAHDAIWMIWAALDGSTRLASDGPLQAWSRARLATFVEQTIGIVLTGLTSSRP